MWTAVYMIEGIDSAQQLENKLQAEGFLVKKRPFSREGETVVYEILVPEFEAKDVQSVLLDLGY